MDLFVAWLDDPSLNIAIHRDVNCYEFGSRYNALHISKLTITIVDKLVEVGLVAQAIGFLDRERNQGRITRIWPTYNLVEQFKEARFGRYDVQCHDSQESIILKDAEGKEIGYNDNQHTRSMRSMLSDYNGLLSRTFIDIPNLELPFIELEGSRDHRINRISVDQSSKFIRRIFNRGSWNKGGRFYGGWWQRCPKNWREQIFINDEAISELDYSGLHIVILYAQLKLDYWALGIGDPYNLADLNLDFSSDAQREVIKLLFLVSLNARNEKAAFSAFRQQAPTGSPEKRLKDDQLKTVLDALRVKHKVIADKIASDAGIDLMRQDSEIAARVIQFFTNSSIPILTIHDSFIVPMGFESMLEDQMQLAFEAETGIRGIRIKEVTDNPEKCEPLHLEDASSFDLRHWEDVVQRRSNPRRSQRYMFQMNEFEKHHGPVQRTAPQYDETDAY